MSTYYSADDTYAYVSGTSFSSPLTASVAAYLFSAYPEATNLQVEEALYEGAKDLGDPGWDEMFGNGRVDSYGAIVRLQQLLNFTDDVPPTVSIESPVDIILSFLQRVIFLSPSLVAK